MPGTRWLVAVLAVAAFFRFFHLGSKSLWLDESISLARIMGSFRAMLLDVALHDGHPPVFYSVLYLLTLPFRSGGFSDAVLRYPSALAGIGAVAVLYFMEKKLWPERRIPFSALFSAISAFAVFYAQDARNYCLNGLWIALAGLFLLQAADEESPSSKTLLGFVASMTLALYTFYYSLFFLVSGAVAFLVLRKFQKGTRVRWAGFFGLPFLCFLFYVPIILRMKARLQAAGAPMCPALPDLHAWALALTEIAQGFNPIHTRFGAVGLALLALPAALPVLLMARKYSALEDRGKLALFLLLGPVVLLFVFPYKPHHLEAKHLFFVLPFYALALCGLPVRPGRKPGRDLFDRGLCTLCFLALAAINLHSLSYYLDETFVKENWRGTARFLTQEMGPGDLAVPAPGYLQFPLKRYLPKTRQASVRSLDTLARPEDLAANNEAELPALRHVPKLWLVELLNSPVSFDDRLTKGLVQRGRKSGYAREFPGFLGTVRVTTLERRESSPR